RAMDSLSATGVATCSCTTPRSVAMASGPLRRVRRSSSKSSTARRARRRGTSPNPKTTPTCPAPPQRRRTHPPSTTHHPPSAIHHPLPTALKPLHSARGQVRFPVLHCDAECHFGIALFLHRGDLLLHELCKSMERNRLLPRLRPRF